MNYPTLIAVFLLGLHAGQQACGDSTAIDPVFQAPVSLDNTTLREHPFVKHSENMQLIRASFTQEKKIKALSRPLVSSGQFFFSKAHGACWQTLKPFSNTVVITQDRISQTNRRGDVETFKSSRHPMLKAMTEVFTAMLAMNPENLAKHFDVYASESGNAWKIGLTPLNSDMRKMIHAILLEGAAQDLNTLTLFEQYGDTTSFSFSYGDDRDAELTAEERAWFEAR